MSRCFPFPPPGYEKKARTEDNSDILKKEKHNEKKHKKEKKEKEKRENKERKEKNKSDGKRKEKKDKNQKHRDKKKDKDKDKNNNLDNKRVPGGSEGHDSEKALDEKKLPGKFESQTLENYDKKENAMDKYWRGEKNAGALCNGGRLSENSYQTKEFRDHSIVQELGRRVKDEERGSGSQFVAKFSVSDSKLGEGMARPVAKTTGAYLGEKEKNSVKEADDKKLVRQGIRCEARFSGNAMVQNYVGISQTRADGIPENNAEKVVHGREQIKENEGVKARGVGNYMVQNHSHTGFEGIPGKQKKDGEVRIEAKEKVKEWDGVETRISGNTLVTNLSGIGQTEVEATTRKLEKDGNMVVEGKEKTKENESFKHGDKHKKRSKEKSSQKKDKKNKEKSDQKRHEQDKSKESKDVLIGNLNSKTSHVPMQSNKNAIADENNRKRKDIETSGYIQLDDARLNKLPRLNSSHSLAENGRILDTGQASEPDDRERKVNGIGEAHSFPAISAKHSSSRSTTEVSIKPPHPDSQYLSEVLSVPKMEEFSDFDDQDWLFHNTESKSKKQKLVECSKIEDTPLVWANSLPIESADIIALPYVIPY